MIKQTTSTILYFEIPNLSDTPNQTLQTLNTKPSCRILNYDQGHQLQMTTIIVDIELETPNL